MARQKSGTKLTSKLEAAKALQAEIAKLQAAEKARATEETEQRQRIAGRVLLGYAAAHPQAEFTRTMHEILGAGLKRKTERLLFGMEATAAADHDAKPAPHGERTEAATAE